MAGHLPHCDGWFGGQCEPECPVPFAAVVDELRAAYRPGVPDDVVPVGDRIRQAARAVRDQVPPELPDDDGPCVGTCAGCDDDCPLQHNPHYGARPQAGTRSDRHVDRARRRFGMCDYPDRR